MTFLAARGIQTLFLFLAFRALIIFGASAVSVFAPVCLPAAERTAKIDTASITGMGEK
jgi:hypothetical protein